MPLCDPAEGCPDPVSPLVRSWCCRPDFYQQMDLLIASAVPVPGPAVIPAAPAKALFVLQYGDSAEIYENAYTAGRAITVEEIDDGNGNLITVWRYPFSDYQELYAANLLGCTPRGGPSSKCRPAVGYS